MLLIQLIAIAVLQGVTEFLPISSSGHLILLPHVTGWPDHGLVVDVAAHFGTLIAVVTYFRADLMAMTAGWVRNVRGGAATPLSRLAWAVLWGTVPVSVIGLLTHDFIAENLRHPLIVAATTIGFGVVLLLSDRYGSRVRETESITWSDIWLVGCAQCLALIPGTSRSGITMSAALAVGFTRTAAARFSFLLSIPVIFLAAGYETMNLVGSDVAVDWTGLITVTLGAAVSAFICIAVFLRLLDRIGMQPFVWYRFFLGGALIWLYA